MTEYEIALAKADAAYENLKAVRRACESSEAAKAAGRAAKSNPDAPGHDARSGDRSYSRAVEATGRKMSEYKAALKVWRAAKAEAERLAQ